MAMLVQRSFFGVDVAKDELVIFDARNDVLVAIPNTSKDIKRWLKAMPAKSAIAIEATNVYHQSFTELAHAKGADLYMVGGFELSHYRKGVNVRAKTDAQDARLLARYLSREIDQLKPWSPPPAVYSHLLSLFRRRAALVQARTGLVQSWSNEPLLKAAFAEQIRSMQRLEALVESKIKTLIEQAGLLAQLKRCMKVEGVGLLTAARLLASFQRGEFRNADAFIAFLGMDLRVAQSGKRQGKRCLTKRGDAEARRLLYNAAMSASRTKAWKTYYEGLKARGMHTTQALVCLARKLARVVFALMKSQGEYVSKAA